MSYGQFSIQNESILKISDSNQLKNLDYNDIIENFLFLGGTTWLTDSLFLYPNIFVGSIGFIFNMFTLIILQDNEFSINLYKYLRVYCVNSIVVCFISIFIFISNTYRFVSWSGTYYAQLFYLSVYVPISSTGYFFGTTMDILITCERIANFNKRFEYFRHNPYKLSAITFLICLSINFPFFFVFQPYLESVRINATFNYSCWFSPQQSSFALSIVGTIITVLIYIVRDFLIMIIEIILNILSVYYLRDYIIKKANLLSVSHINANIALTTQIESITGSTSSKEINTINFMSNSKMSKSDRRLSIMCSILCFFSICEHIIYIVSVMFQYFSDDLVTFNIIFFCATFLIDLKNAVNFPLFYYFNTNFKKVIHKKMKLRLNRESST